MKGGKQLPPVRTGGVFYCFDKCFSINRILSANESRRENGNRLHVGRNLSKPLLPDKKFCPRSRLMMFREKSKHQRIPQSQQPVHAKDTIPSRPVLQNSPYCSCPQPRPLLVEGKCPKCSKPRNEF